MYASSSYAFVVAGALAFAFFVASIRLKVALVVFVVSCLVLSASPAFAQIDTPSIFGSWRPYIVEIVGIAIAAALGWIFELIRRRTGLDIEAKHREALQSALTNAAGLVIAKTGDALEGFKPSTGNVRMDEGIVYVLKSVPDAIAYFGLTPDKLRDLLEAKLGVVIAAPSANPSA